MTDLRFTIGDGRTYDAADIETLSLRDILTIERETEALGRRMTFSDITAMLDEMAAMGQDVAITHPDAPWVLAVTIWASRRAVGESLTFGEAIDFPLKDLRFIRPPADRQPVAKAKADPTRPRPASGRGRKSVPAREQA